MTDLLDQDIVDVTSDFIVNRVGSCQLVGNIRMDRIVKYMEELQQWRHIGALILTGDDWPGQTHIKKEIQRLISGAKK